MPVMLSREELRINLHPAALALQLEVLGPPEGIIGGANSLVFSKLGENNSRRVDSSECMGTCVKANRCSHAVKGTTLGKILRGRDTKCFSGSSKAPRKRGSRARERYSGPIFERDKKDGSKRPVFNLRQLNQWIEYSHFKMEGMTAVIETIIQGDWMIKIDIRDAYFCVAIAPEHRKFLRFRWEGSLFQFNSRSGWRRDRGCIQNC